MDRRIAALLALVAVAVLDAACSKTEPAAAPAPNTVTIRRFLFRPETLSVKSGTAVVWTNRDDIAHTVSSGTPGHLSGVFDSGDRTLGRAFTRTFSTAGTFAYFCKNHNSMTGRVTVT